MAMKRANSKIIKGKKGINLSHIPVKFFISLNFERYFPEIINCIKDTNQTGDSPQHRFQIPFRNILLGL